MEPYWAFVVIYLCGGWVGGIITQTIINEVVDHRSRKRSASWIREIRSSDRLAEAVSGPARPRQHAGSSARAHVSTQSP